MLTYNREKLIGRAIESIMRQTYQDFEFIVVDNGSTDGSGKIADEYAKWDLRIRVIHIQQRGNIGSGRNAGLDRANGDYITFIDDDDWCEPNLLQFLHDLAMEYGADISICGADDKIFDEKCAYTPEEALMVLFWRRRFNNQFPTKLIKRGLFDNMRFSDSAKYDDIELMPLIFAKANRIAFHGVSLYTFYRHGGNNSAWTQDHRLLDPQTLEEYLDVYRKRTEVLSKMFPNHAAAYRYFEWSFMLSMVEKVARLGLRDCVDIAKRLRLTLRENLGEFMDCQLVRDFERDWIKEYVINYTM
jgi:glycosyltransferase involved in cell wall biosynthesis